MEDFEPLIRRAAADLGRARHAIALTGAGISTESGIPDFRGPSGVWTKNPEAERAAYRSYERFQRDPGGWWEESLAARGRGMLGDLDAVSPNPGHLALAELEAMGILQAVLTQNVDGLHERAGSQRVLAYHGTYNKLRCIACSARFRRDAFDLDALQRKGRLPPVCPQCGGTVKTDGVAFGEPIPMDVAMESAAEAQRCDVMLICGTSAVVYPFASLPIRARERRGVVIIEVNTEPTPLTQGAVSDYLIQGKTGEVLPAIVAELQRSMAE